jgi:hypothetical protein
VEKCQLLGNSFRRWIDGDHAISEGLRMVKKNIIIAKRLKIGGGFDVTDRELAQWELEENQRKLNRVWVPPAGSREEATQKLNETLSDGKTVKQQQLAPAVMKFDQAPKATSRKQAERQLRRTQELLSHARVKQNASINNSPKPDASLVKYPVKDAKNMRPQDLDVVHKNAIERLVNNAPDSGISVEEIAKSLGIDPERVRTAELMLALLILLL